MAHQVVAVAYDGQCMFELGIATELFGLDRPELDRQWYELRVVAATPGAPLRTLGGLQLAAAFDLGAIRAAGTIVLPGWNRDVDPDDALLDALRVAHGRGARIMTICSGVFLLAATGLLDGRPATTHWRYTDELAAAYPLVDVRPNVLYVDDGELLTSAGSAAGIDLGLYLIRRDHGADVAARVARRLVVAPQRSGGQAQFAARTSGPSGLADDGLGDLLAWMVEHLDERLTVATLARRVHQSPRTLARRFTDLVGVPPLQWLTRERVRRAQELLETTEGSVDRIAAAVGFGSAETLRHHFRRALGTTPTAYRAAFAVRRSA